MASQDQEFSPSTHQEYDTEPSSYVGLEQPDMYKKYIEEIIAKYPEHMARRMPNLMEQQRNLLEFINDLAKNDRSPSGQFSNVDKRYQILDDAVDIYKLYENAVKKVPDPFGSKKLFNKRGTLLEIIEVDPEDLKKFKLPLLGKDSSNNSSS